MHYHIEQNFLCPFCGGIHPVLFCSDEEVSIRDMDISDENGKWAERLFQQPTVCDTCGKSFTAFIKVRFCHNKEKVSAYDSGKVLSEEIGVAFTR